MTHIRKCDPPASSLLNRYQSNDNYVDCYVTELPGAISLSSFIEAFYTTPLFKLERKLIGLFARRPATNADAKELAKGTTNTFSAWQVEQRDSTQLLVADFTGNTKSWFHVTISTDPAGNIGQLYFGSAVVAHINQKTGKREIGTIFHALLGFHKLYSRLLLRSAASQLRKQLGPSS